MVKQLRVPGHTLASEGMAHNLVGHLRWSAATGPGCAKCSCGELSDVLPTGAARKRWHREHKQQILADEGDDR